MLFLFLIFFYLGSQNQGARVEGEVEDGFVGSGKHHFMDASLDLFFIGLFVVRVISAVYSGCCPFRVEMYLFSCSVHINRCRYFCRHVEGRLDAFNARVLFLDFTLRRPDGLDNSTSLADLFASFSVLTSTSTPKP